MRLAILLRVAIAVTLVASPSFAQLELESFEPGLSLYEDQQFSACAAEWERLGRSYAARGETSAPEHSGFSFVLAAKCREQDNDALAYSSWGRAIRHFLESGTSWEQTRARMSNRLSKARTELEGASYDDAEGGGTVTLDIANAVLFRLDSALDILRYNGPRAGLESRTTATPSTRPADELPVVPAHIPGVFSGRSTHDGGPRTRNRAEIPTLQKTLIAEPEGFEELPQRDRKSRKSRRAALQGDVDALLEQLRSEMEGKDPAEQKALIQQIMTGVTSEAKEEEVSDASAEEVEAGQALLRSGSAPPAAPASLEFEDFYEDVEQEEAGEPRTWIGPRPTEPESGAELDTRVAGQTPDELSLAEPNELTLDSDMEVLDAEIESETTEESPVDPFSLVNDEWIARESDDLDWENLPDSVEAPAESDAPAPASKEIAVQQDDSPQEETLALDDAPPSETPEFGPVEPAKRPETLMGPPAPTSLQADPRDEKQTESIGTPVLEALQELLD